MRPSGSPPPTSRRGAVPSNGSSTTRTTGEPSSRPAVGDPRRSPGTPRPEPSPRRSSGRSRGGADDRVGGVPAESVLAAAEQQVRDRLEDDEQVQGDRPVLDVEQVETHVLVE